MKRYSQGSRTVTIFEVKVQENNWCIVECRDVSSGAWWRGEVESFVIYARADHSDLKKEIDVWLQKGGSWLWR